MKIGILTFHRSFNYGAFMQCFSLVNKLKEDFPNAEFEVVDYTVKRAIDNYMKEIQTQKSKKLKGLLMYRVLNMKKWQMNLKDTVRVR